MYLCGSKALDYHCGTKFSEKSDIDLILTDEEKDRLGIDFAGKSSAKIGKIEYHNIDTLNNRAIIEYCKDKCETIITNKVLPMSILRLIKRSHLHRPLNFTRHIIMYQKLQTFELNTKEEKLLKERTILTKQQYKDRVPSLRKTNEDFFNDPVKKYYVHDDLHKILAYGDEPVYEKLKIDKEMAFCERDLWNQLPYGDKVKCVQEEMFVIALERFIIPKLEVGEKHMPMKFATNASLEKICTTLCSGWFRDFAIDNFETIRNYDRDILGIFNERKRELRNA